MVGDDRRSGGGFAAALQNLTDHIGAVTATSTAKMIGYPTTGVDLQRGHTQVGMALLAAASLARAVLVGLAPAIITRRRRRLAVGSVTTA